MGKVALITGGRSGIGLACAQKLSQKGYDVVTAQRSPAVDFYSIEADFSESETPQKVIQQVIDRHGRLDVLINNAGIVAKGDILDLSEADFDRVIAVNLKGIFLVAREAARQMVDQIEEGG